MEKKIKTITGLLVVSLALNLYSMVRLGRIEENLIMARNNEHRVIDILRNDIGGLFREINEIKGEGKWVISKEFKPNQEASSPEEIHLDLLFSLKELEVGAKVLLLYRNINESQGWIEIEANNIERNLFSAPLILLPEKEYEYKVVAEGTIVKVDEVTGIPSQYYRPTPLTIGGAGGSHNNDKWFHFDVSFHQHTPILFDFYRVKEVNARMYFDSKSTTFRLVPRTQGQFKEWNLNITPEDLDGEITKIILEIQYENGRMEEENFTDDILEMMARMIN